MPSTPPAPERFFELERFWWIDGALERGRRVFLHRRGGHGRTGTLRGEWRIRHGRATPEDFVDVSARLRAHDPTGSASPENETRVRSVRDYVAGRAR